MKNYDKKITLLPRGINDLLEKKSFQDSFLSQTLMNSFKLNGYEKVSPPMICLLYTSPSPRDGLLSRMPSSA